MTDEDTADRLRDALRGVEGLVSAYLFGSMAEGRAHRESDVDVGVLLDRQVFPSAEARFNARLVLPGLLRRAAAGEVDLVVLNDAPPQLARHIMFSGRPLWIADAARDHAHRRLVLSRAADLEPFLRRTRAIKLQALAP
jgi:predicted nucleotidyltransferase